MPEVQTLGVTWSNRGFRGLPDDLVAVLHRAFDASAPEPLEPPGILINLFHSRLRRWEQGGAPVHWDLVALIPGLRPIPVFAQPAISKIAMVGQPPRFDRWLEPQSEWRWTFYYPAFTIFWALAFHLTNDELADPIAAWDGLMALFFDQLGVTRREDRVAVHGLHLALYERLMGIYCDIGERRPHYVHNIVERPGLGSASLSQRPGLFQGFVDHFRSSLEAALATKVE
ncbi:MAG: hypothetical protein HYY50_02255 [Candidatus Kerfeldbacteria bacterium]|nr:hypothetical protein [Candidatus Kerfeldbacteria bacterium]